MTKVIILVRGDHIGLIYLGSHNNCICTHSESSQQKLMQRMQLPGAPIPPEAMMHFPSVSNFPLFSKNFQTLWKIFKILPFPDDLFLVIDHNLSKFPPIFPVSVHSPPLFRENYYFPLLSKISPPLFEKFTCFLHTFCVFRFPPTLIMMHLINQSIIIRLMTSIS